MKCRNERLPGCCDAGSLREVPQRVVERDEDRELREHRQARRRRVDVVLPVELHQLFVLLRLVALVLLLDLLHLRREALQVLHRVDLLHRQRHEQHPDDHRQRDDRPRPRQVHAEVQPVEDVAGDVLERRDEREARGSSDRVEPSVAPRVAAQEPPAGEERAAHEALLPHRVDRVLRAGRVVLAGRREERAERDAGRARPPRRRAGTSGGRLRHRQHLVDALAEPLEAVRRDGVRQPGPHDQHVVVARPAPARAGRSRPRAAAA